MAVTGQMALAEFMRLPEVKPARELWHGVISQKMSPGGPHSALQVELVKRLDGAGEPGRRLRIFTEARVLFEVDTLVPDLIAYREDRVPSTEDGEVPPYFADPPDIAIEVASPGQTLGNLLQRCRDLVSLGVSYVVLLIPHPKARRTVYVFGPDGETGPLTGPDVVDLSDLATGLRFTVDEIFSALRARPG